LPSYFDQSVVRIRLARGHGIKPTSSEELAQWWQDAHVIEICPPCRAADVHTRPDLFDKTGHIRPSDAGYREAWRTYLRGGSGPAD
jgi:hypothetical protein